MSINLISYQTIVRKQVMRLFTLWIQTLIPPVITMTLYFMIFGRFMDHGWYALTLTGAAVTLFISVYAAIGVGRRTA